MMSKGRRKYSADFKAKAVELARNMGSMREAAEALGVATPSLYDWKKAAENTGLESRESTLVEKLNKEIKQLRTELKEQQKIIHLLKQAAIFFLPGQEYEPFMLVAKCKEEGIPPRIACKALNVS